MSVKHIHLIEFHEQPWFPPFLRDAVTDYLHYVTAKMDAYKSITPLLADELKSQTHPQILDLCSGGTGGIAQVQQHLEVSLGREVQVLISDKFPNIDAFEKIKHETGGKVDFVKESVDVMDVPEKYKGMRTLFNAFHHFRPSEAEAIIKDAVQDEVPIAIVEANDKSWIQGILIVLLAPIMVLLLTPFIKPFRWTRILFTYLIPIIPLLIAWDGLVSVIRLYSPAQLKTLTSQFANYEWKIGKLKDKGGTLIYAIGGPQDQ